MRRSDLAGTGVIPRTRMGLPVLRNGNSVLETAVGFSPLDFIRNTYNRVEVCPPVFTASHLSPNDQERVPFHGDR